MRRERRTTANRRTMPPSGVPAAAPGSASFSSVRIPQSPARAFTRGALSPARIHRGRSAFSLSPARTYRAQSPVRGKMRAPFPLSPDRSLYQSHFPVYGSIPSSGRRRAAASVVLYGTWSPSMSPFPQRGRAQVPLSTSSTLLRGRILPARRSPVRMRMLSPPSHPVITKASVLKDGEGKTAQEWQDYIRANFPGHELVDLDGGATVSRPIVSQVWREEKRIVSVPVGTGGIDLQDTRSMTRPRSIKSEVPSEMDKVDTSSWTLEDDLRFGSVGLSTREKPWLRRSRALYTRSLSPPRISRRQEYWIPDTQITQNTTKLQVGGDQFIMAPATPPVTMDSNTISKDESLPATRLSFDTPPRGRIQRPDWPSSPNTESPLAPSLLPKTPQGKRIYTSPPPTLLPKMSPRNNEHVQPSSMTVELDLDYRTTIGGGPDVRQKFEEDFIDDLAEASRLPKETFRILNVSPGSIVIVVEVLPDLTGNRERPEDTILGLIQQAQDRNSALLAGRITSKTTQLALTSDVYNVRAQTAIADTCLLVSLCEDRSLATPHDDDAPIFKKQTFAAQRAAAKRRQDVMEGIDCDASEPNSEVIFDEVDDFTSLEYAKSSVQYRNGPDEDSMQEARAQYSNGLGGNGMQNIAEYDERYGDRPGDGGPQTGPVKAAIDYVLPEERLAFKPDLIHDPVDEDPPRSFVDAIMQSPVLSWLTPRKATADGCRNSSRHTTAPLEAVLSSRGQVASGILPQKSHTAAQEHEQIIAQLKAQVADLQNEMAYLKKSKSPLHRPLEPPYAAPSISQTPPGPATRAMVPNPGEKAFSPQTLNLSPKYTQSLTLEDRGVDRPADSLLSTRSAPEMASAKVLIPTSPDRNIYKLSDREYIGREYRGGLRLPRASGRLTLEASMQMYESSPDDR